MFPDGFFSEAFDRFGPAGDIHGSDFSKGEIAGFWRSLDIAGLVIGVAVIGHVSQG